VDNLTKKELQAQYKEREIIGGVYIIRNTMKNRLLLDAAVDIHGSKSRYEFAIKTGSCVHPKLQNDWLEQKGGQFEFEILDELKKGETQTNTEFKADIELMKEMWLEKLSGEDLY
jgi:hypothetical protein